MSTEVTIGDRTYIIGTIPVRAQFHTFRRVLPLMGPILESLKAGFGFSALTLISISDDLAKLTDEQLDYVMDNCLAVVQVEVKDSAPMKLMVNGRPMFPLDLSTTMQLTWAVLMENFRPFLKGMLDRQSSAVPQTSETSSS